MLPSHPSVHVFFHFSYKLDSCHTLLINLLIGQLRTTMNCAWPHTIHTLSQSIPTYESLLRLTRVPDLARRYLAPSISITLYISIWINLFIYVCSSQDAILYHSRARIQGSQDVKLHQFRIRIEIEMAPGTGTASKKPFCFSFEWKWIRNEHKKGQGSHEVILCRFRIRHNRN